MTNNTSGINTEIKVNGQKLETVTSFRYLGSVITDEGSKPEILPRTAQTTAALTRLKPVWNDRSIFSQLQDTTDAPSCLYIKFGRKNGIKLFWYKFHEILPKLPDKLVS